MGKSLMSCKGLSECEGCMLLLGLGEGATREAFPVLKELQMWDFSVTHDRVLGEPGSASGFWTSSPTVAFLVKSFPLPQ